MQGISASKHRHLVDALLQLERILDQACFEEENVAKAAALRAELHLMYRKYQRQMQALEQLITAYHELFGHAKLKFLSPKLRELKKTAEQENDARGLPLLAQNIRLVYGT